MVQKNRMSVNCLSVKQGSERRVGLKWSARMTYDLNVRADLAPSTQAGGWANKNLHKKPGFFMGWRFITDVEGTRQALVDSLNIPFSPCP